MLDVMRLLSLALLASLTGSIRADVLTVDDDGGADYTDLQAAIDGAHAGDVLHVADGEYGAFTLDKRLSILGRSGVNDVHVAGISRVTGVVSARLAGLTLDALEIEQTSRAVVQDCEVGYVGPAFPPGPSVKAALVIRDCGDVLIADSTLQGLRGCCGDSPWPTGIAFGAGSAGLRVESSDVSVVDCDVNGGPGYTGCDWNTGGTGIEVRGGVTTVAGSTVQGGPGGTFECLSTGSGDPGGDAVWVLDGIAVLRGGGTADQADYASGGLAGLGAEAGLGVRADGSSLVVHSGTSVSSLGAFGAAQITSPAKVEPFLELSGDLASHGIFEVHAHAPVGEPLFLFFAFGLAPSTVGGVDGTVWLSGSTVFAPLTGQGQASPVVLPLALPPTLTAFVGLELGMQLVAPATPGSLDPGAAFLSNAAPLLAR